MILELLILGVLGLLGFLAWTIHHSMDKNIERLTKILWMIRVLNNRVSEIEKQLDIIYYNDLTEEEENHE